MFAIMENSVKKIQVEGGDKEILYSKTIKAGNYIDIYITPYKATNIKIDTSTTSPYIDIKNKFTGRIYSMSQDSNYLTPEVLDAISSTCSSYLESAFSSLLYKTSKEFHSDIHGFGRYALSTFLTTDEESNYHWLENYRDAFFDIEIETSIKSGMLITET